MVVKIISFTTIHEGLNNNLGMKQSTKIKAFKIYLFSQKYKKY
jgi:hypothetical protein